MRAATGFVPLHVKSHFSIGLGTASIPALVQHAGRVGFPALALTDLENLSGQVQFHAACGAAGIIPITGVELRESYGKQRGFGARRGRVVLLAADARGYANLCQIVTQRRTGPNHSRPPLESLRGSLTGLVLLSDDPDLLEPLTAMAGRQWVRALLVRPDAEGELRERALLARAKALEIGIAADLDAELLGPDQWDLQRLARAVHLRQHVGTAPASREETQRALSAPHVVERLFSDLPDAVAETARIAQLCSFDLLQQRTERAHPAAEQNRVAIEQRCLAALGRRRAAHAPRAVYVERLRAELATIVALGYCDLFTSAESLAERARERAIPIAARGSAVSSLVLHLLGVSPIDPLQHGLQFERFVSAARRTPPDVDIDVSSRRRDELVDWLIAFRGAERTVRLSSIATFRARSAHRAGLKALGAPAHVIESFSKRFPPDELQGHERWAVPRSALPPPWREQLETIGALAGMPRHLSQHPGGIALSSAGPGFVLPLERGRSGADICQYDAESIARLGIPKIDLLGNHCLDELDATIESFEARAEDAAGALELARDPPLDDPKTLELIANANTIGCVQIESPAMRAVLAGLAVRSFEDLIHALAIVRPGPASGHAKDLFIARARGEPHEPEPSAALSRVLPGTHGVLLFEEDIALLLARMTGIPLDRAEALRVRVAEREDDAAWIERARGRFVRAARERGFERRESDEVWSTIVRFASYAFNKAHAASQALLAYRAAYYKRHAPVDFGCALLNHHGGLYPRRALASELVRRGVPLLPPSLVRSSLECSVESLAALKSSGEAVRIGLGLIKGVSAGSRERLLAARGGVATPADVELLLRAARPTPRELRALVWSGACDAALGLDMTDYPWVHEAVLQRLEGARSEALAAVIAAARTRRPKEPPALVERYSRLCRIQNELRYLEMHVSDHPLRVLRSEADRQSCVPSNRLREHIGRDLRFAGVVVAARSVPMGARDVGQFLTFEDEHGLIEARLAPELYDVLQPRVTTPGPFLLSARVGERYGALHLTVRDLIPFHQRAEHQRADAASDREAPCSERTRSDCRSR